MKRKGFYNIRTGLLTCIGGFLLTFTACNYDEIGDGDYPEQSVYLPITQYNEGILTIDNVPAPIEHSPSNGRLIPFSIENNRMLIPLSIYRAGVDRKGSVNVSIEINTDTIQSLIANGTLDNSVEILPADKYSIPQTVSIPDGTDISTFHLNVDLDFLKTNTPNKKYGIGIAIVGADREIKSTMATAIVVIDTKFLIHQPTFSSKADNTKWTQVTFTNTSSNALSWSWDFGDGTTSNEYSPVHTYSKGGIYNTTLTTYGAGGDALSSTQKVVIIKIDNIAHESWSVVDFSSERAVGNEQYPDQGKAISAIDGDINTFWMTNSTSSYPHHITVDMGKEYIMSSFEACRRPGSSSVAQTEIEFYTSNDGQNWEKWGPFEFDNKSADMQKFELTEYPTGRYFKFQSTKGSTSKAATTVGEINVYGALNEE